MTPQRWRRIDELFHAALELPAGEADEFLRRACGEDAALYEDVRRMLEEHNRTGLLDSSPWSLTAPPSEPGVTFLDGELVAGRYCIVRFLSRGGMGEVYEAEDVELGERIALKTLLPAIAADARMIARFKQEIQLSRKVAHPNVCRVFDLSRHPLDASTSATYFLTMELLAGETLSEKIQRDGPMPFDAAMPLIEQMADALDAAHAAGVIHRDFKPSNVMLVPSSGGTRAIVTDFGLARSFRPDETAATQSSRIMGTLEYMAPELLSGGAATTASDVYALGMVAHRMLTGVLPSTSGELASALPAAAQRTILQAIDVRPGVRFSSGREFVRALRGLTSPSISVSISPAARRYVAAGVAVAAVFLGVTGWLMWKSAHARPSPEALELYRQAAQEIDTGTYYAAMKTLQQALVLAPKFPRAHARLAEAWLGLLVPERAKDEMLAARRDAGGMTSSERLQVEAIDAMVARDFPAAAAKFEQLYRSAPDAFAVELGRAYESAERVKDAIATYEQAAKTSKNPAAWLQLGVIWSRTNPEGAADAFRRAEEGYREANNFEGVIETLFQRGIGANRRGDYATAIQDLQKARETARMAGHLQQEIAATLQLGTSALNTNDTELAEKYAREALDQSQANQMEIMAITAMINLGQVRGRARDFAGAENYYRSALALSQRAGTYSRAALCQLTLATLYSQMGRQDEMLANAKAALQFFERNARGNEMVACLFLIARYQRSHGDMETALETARRAAQLAGEIGSRAQASQAVATIASIYSAEERYPEALEAYRKNLDPATDPTLRRYAVLQTADMLTMLGRGGEARELLKRSSELVVHDPTLALRLKRLRAALALSEGDDAEAISTARAVLGDATIGKGDAFETERILGLALVGSGKKAEGRKICEGLAAKVTAGDAGMAAAARLAILEARVATGDRTGALEVFAQLAPLLNARPETRWQALALVSKFDAGREAEARGAVAELERLWGPGAFHDYVKRRDIGPLARPLLGPDSAKTR